MCRSGAAKISWPSAASCQGIWCILPERSHGFTLLQPGSLPDLTIIVLIQIPLLCADLGLLDLLAFQSKLPGMLLYAVTLGGYSGDILLQRGSIDTLLTQAENTTYALNFTLDPQDSHRVSKILL